jgi:hypothetical protein
MIKKTVIQKILAYLSPLFFVITCGIFGIYTYLHHSIIPTYQKKLTVMAHNRSNEINAYLNEQEKNALQLSQEPVIINFPQFSFHSKPGTPSKETEDGNETVQNEREEKPFSINKNKQQSLINLLATHKESMGFKNILLIDKNGTILFSTTTKKNLVGLHINQPLYTNSSLSKSYERASMTLTNDFSNFNFNDLLQEPALFITIPILKEKKFIGTLSYQLNQEKIFLITNQYIGLEKTGETVLAKKEDSNAVFLSPTRNDPDLAFKKRALVTDAPIAIGASIVGKEGSGAAIDYRDKKIVGAWEFIPKLDWGMIIKIDQDELLQSTNILYQTLLLFLIIFILSLIMDTYLFYPRLKRTLKNINKQSPLNKVPALLKNPLFIALLIFSGFTAKNIILCEKSKLSTIEKAQKKVLESNSKNAANIQNILEKIAFVGQSIAHDLHTHYLAKDDIATRIKRDKTENNIITEISVVFEPYTYDTTTELYIQTTSDKQRATNPFKTKWYTQAIEKGSAWLINSHKNSDEKEQTAQYVCTFFDKDQHHQGVITLTFSLKKIIEIAEYSSIGQTGYAILMDNNGTFIYHPLSNLVQTETTLLQYAQSKGNEELASVAQKVITGKPVMASYVSESAHERFWIYTQTIEINNWIIGSIFSQEEVSVPAEISRHYYFWILIWFTMTLLLLLALLWRYAFFSPTCYAIIANIILILGLITSWYTIKKTTTINRESRTIITDQSNLNKFLNDLNDEAERKHEAPPINIPSGILLYSLSLSGSDNITISGYLWNKYNTQLHTNLVRGMDLPQATRMTYGNPLLSQADHTETSTWNIQGVMFQEQDYAKYPFDQQQIRIFLEHKDIEKNIILTPDLIAYKKISPESTPGLDKDFSIAGFTIEQSFFEYHKINPSANFGFKEYGKVTDNYQLIYNAIMNRNLLNPFILYLLPLLIILFSLFSTLLVTGKNTPPLSILGGYTGLFFALILLQRSLREQFPTGTTLYIEYAFFYTYITIIFLIIHTILMYYYKRWESYQNNSLYFMRILFWPFQFIAWLITTLIVFY